MTTKAWLTSGFVVLALAVVLAVNGVRFMGLDKAPPGAHVDEAANGVLLQCMATEWLDGALEKPHLFGYPGPTGYTYEYVLPGALWVKAFGFSVASIRAYSAMFFVLAVAGLAMLAYVLWGWECAVWAALIASVCPWMWPVSRIGYEASPSLPFFIWGMYFFFRSNAWRDALLAGLVFAISAYAYPPYRMDVALILGLLFLIKWRIKGLKLWPTMLFLVVFALTLIPLAIHVLGGQMTYFSDISIFSPAFLAEQGRTSSPGDLLAVLWKYYAMHLDPRYLFMKGGGTVMYTTGFGGLLGPVEILGIVGAGVWLLRGFWKNRKLIGLKTDVFWAIVLAAGFLVCMLPAAFTRYNVPNALRASGAWPFAVLFVTYFLWRWSSKIKGLGMAVAILGAVFISAYLKDYFVNYPRRGQMDFSVMYHELARSAKVELDWVKFVVLNKGDGMRARYYLMQYKGETCTAANTFYMNVSGYFKSRGW